MERNEELRPEETVKDAEDWLRKSKVEQFDTQVDSPLPLSVEYPLIFKVRDLLLEKNYILADQYGKRTAADDDTPILGLMLEPTLEPTNSRLKLILRKLFRPSLRWIGAIHCEDREDECVLRIFGKNNVAGLVELSSEIGNLLKKPVIPRLASETEKKESRWFAPNNQPQ